MLGFSGPGSSGLHGNLTRSKSNKGSVDGQFSHEFLHRPVWGGRLVGFCAGGAVPVWV